jgi:2-oxoglutarate dehydrogenase E2 component (dihydrolipoamide succinyltransferase)
VRRTAPDYGAIRAELLRGSRDAATKGPAAEALLEQAIEREAAPRQEPAAPASPAPAAEPPAPAAEPPVPAPAPAPANEPTAPAPAPASTP